MIWRFFCCSYVSTKWDSRFRLHCQNNVTSHEGRIYGRYCKNRHCLLCCTIRKAEPMRKGGFSIADIGKHFAQNQYICQSLTHLIALPYAPKLE